MVFYIFPGLACIILAAVIYGIDLINPTATASFFNIDILTTFEDSVIIKSKHEPDEEEDESGGGGETPGIKLVESNSNANGESRVEEGEAVYGNVEV